MKQRRRVHFQTINEVSSIQPLALERKSFIRIRTLGINDGLEHLYNENYVVSGQSVTCT